MGALSKLFRGVTQNPKTTIPAIIALITGIGSLVTQWQNLSPEALGALGAGIATSIGVLFSEDQGKTVPASEVKPTDTVNVKSE